MPQHHKSLTVNGRQTEQEEERRQTITLCNRRLKTKTKSSGKRKEKKRQTAIRVDADKHEDTWMYAGRCARTHRKIQADKTRTIT